MIGLALWLLATQWGGGAPDEAGQTADVAEIRALTREFVLGFNSGDLDRVMTFYADDYVDVNLRKARQTKVERREYFRRLLDPAHLTVEVTPDEIVVAGDHAFSRGTIRVERIGPGQEASRRELRYGEVLRRLPSGWKAIWGVDAEVYPEPR